MPRNRTNTRNALKKSLIRIMSPPFNCSTLLPRTIAPPKKSESSSTPASRLRQRRTVSRGCLLYTNPFFLRQVGHSQRCDQCADLTVLLSSAIENSVPAVGRRAILINGIFHCSTAEPLSGPSVCFCSNRNRSRDPGEYSYQDHILRRH